MKVAVIGATGKSGQRITAELLQRGHRVLAVVRTPEKVPATKGIEVAKSDLSDVAQLVDVLNGADAVVSAYGPPADDTDQIIGTTKRITEAVKRNKQRLLVVGGAASLFVAPGVTVLASGYLPEPYVPIARSHEQVLKDLKASGADWTNFSRRAVRARREDWKIPPRQGRSDYGCQRQQPDFDGRLRHRGSR